MDQVTIEVPGSSANNGYGYDFLCLALAKPLLRTTYTPSAKPGIEIEVKSPLPEPKGRQRGYSARVALEYFLKVNQITEGAHLLIEDDSYETGGLGRSGAEAVGAVMCAAVYYHHKTGIKGLDRNRIIRLAGMGEPGADQNEGRPGHLDNVAASTNGRFNIISRSPFTNVPSVDFYDTPEDLGIAIGYSSHQKPQGTEGTRKILPEEVPTELMTYQASLSSAMVAALVTGNVNRVLELIWGDRFHEFYRANAGVYGNFNFEEFLDFKREMFSSYNIATIVSGAGPKMLLLRNKKDFHEWAKGIRPREYAVDWFKQKGIDMLIKDAEIAKEGAYDYAQRVYGYGK